MLVGQPATSLRIPSVMVRVLDSAVAAGREDAAGWARIHPAGSTRRFDADVLARLAEPPSGREQDAELDELLAIQARRTDAGAERMRELDARAGWETWEATIDWIGRTQGFEQARRAQRLVQAATDRTHVVVHDAKQGFGRERPFELDSRIDPLIPGAGGSASYPSGHTSGAFAPALVLAALVPERAAELIGLAIEVGYSRMYGGVHFRSDVVAGARIAAAIAADVLRRDGL